VDLPVVHPAPALAPGDVTEQLFEGVVGTRHPARAVVHPGVGVELQALEAAIGHVDAGAPVRPQRRLPGDSRCARGIAHTNSCTGKSWLNRSRSWPSTRSPPGSAAQSSETGRAF